MLPNVILVMGVTGSGKSTLVHNITKKHAPIGNNLESCTASVTEYQFTLDGTTVTLVDTPGFDDTYREDIDILSEIHEWLSVNDQSKPIGILFLHKITDNRMAGSSIKLINMFKELCGDNYLKNVILVTTMWNEDVNNKNDRYKQLCDDYWKLLILSGAKVIKYDNNRTITNSIKDIIVMEELTLQIIQDTKERGLAFHETSAAQAVTEKIPLTQKINALKIEHEIRVAEIERQKNNLILAEQKRRNDLILAEQKRIEIEKPYYMKHALCNKCNKTINTIYGYIYHCHTCNFYDLCCNCFTMHSNKLFFRHRDHFWKRYG